jgi:hypothetical protein
MHLTTSRLWTISLGFLDAENRLTDFSVCLNTTQQSAARNIFVAHLTDIKRIASEKPDRPMRLGALNYPVEMYGSWNDCSIRSALQASLLNLEPGLDSCGRVLRSVYGSALTTSGPFCWYKGRNDKSLPSMWDEVIIIDFSANHFHVSNGGYIGIDGDESFVVTETGMALVEAIKEAVGDALFRPRGVAVAGNTTEEQLHEVMKAIKVGLPDLVEDVRIPFGDPGTTNAVGAACYAWDYAMNPSQHEPEYQAPLDASGLPFFLGRRGEI